MGEVWFAPQPRCPVHGRMRYDHVRSEWTCAGFDGEGCDHVVTDEELDRVPLGTVDDAQWQQPFTVSAREVPGGG